jgi:hypothetical protein
MTGAPNVSFYVGRNLFRVIISARFSGPEGDFPITFPGDRKGFHAMVLEGPSCFYTSHDYMIWFRCTGITAIRPAFREHDATFDPS